MKSFEVKYETAPHIPPPYCYYYQIKGQEEAAGLRINFQWVYHQREELSTEEIEDEGFTGQDDYNWNGLLDQVWFREFDRLVSASRPTAHPDEEEAYLFITATEPGRVLFDGSPRNMTEWEYFLQELIQGIYETSGKEAPLHIRFKKISPDGSSVTHTITLEFGHRKLTLATTPSQGQPLVRERDWDKSREVLQAIYTLDYHPEEASEKEPSTPGVYLDTGEGTWYELGKGANNPSPRKDYIGLIQRFFEGS